MRVLGINAIYHDPAAGLVVDGRIVAAAEEERFSRRKHGKRPVPFAAWEMPDAAARWCLKAAGVPAGRRSTRSPTPSTRGCTCRPRSSAVRPVGPPARHVRRAGRRASSPTRCPGWTRARCAMCPTTSRTPRSAALAGPYAGECAVLVLDGRGERHSHLAAHCVDCRLEAAVLPAAAAVTRPGLRGGDGAPGLPAQQRRVQGDGAGLLRAAAAPGRVAAVRPRDRRRRVSSRPGSTGTHSPSHARPTSSGPPSTPILRPACKPWSRRRCSSWRGGCTRGPARGRWPWPAASH